MYGELILDYLSTADSLIRVRAFLRDFNGLKLDLFDTKGTPRLFADQWENGLNGVSAHRFSNSTRRKNRIPAHSLAQATETKAPVVFKLEDGYLRILIPVVCHDQIAGFLCVAENPFSHLQPGQLKSAVNFLQGVIEAILEKEMRVFSDFKGTRKNHPKKVFSRVIRYIVDNFHSPDLSLEQVSKQHNISYHYLCRLFPQELKMTFSSFLTNTRLNAAMQLLRDKSLTVSQISYSCGFEDPAYFSKVFKRLTGTPPAAYRLQRPTVKKTFRGNLARLSKDLLHSTLSLILCSLSQSDLAEFLNF